MTLAEFQLLASRTRNVTLPERDQLLDAAAGLAEEGGEVLSHVRKHAFQSKPLDPEKLKIELGDALWCLAMTATCAGLSLDDIAAANQAKLRARFPDGYKDR